MSWFRRRKPKPEVPVEVVHRTGPKYRVPEGFRFKSCEFYPDLSSWKMGWWITTYENAAGQVWGHRSWGHEKGRLW